MDNEYIIRVLQAAINVRDNNRKEEEDYLKELRKNYD